MSTEKTVECFNAAKYFEENFTEKQIRVIKAIISGGWWGDADFELTNGGTMWGFGYPTTNAKELINDLTPRQIAGVISGISKKIKLIEPYFFNLIPDYWGEGKSSDGMLFIESDVVDSVSMKEWLETK